MISGIEQQLTLLHRLLPAKPGALAVDVGCGDGSATRALTGSGWRALGLEPDPSEGETLGWGIEVRPIDSFGRAHAT